MINIVLDTSMLDTFQLCELKFHRRYNLNLVTPTKAIPLDRGNIIHVAHENYWNVLKDTRDWVKAVDAALVAFRVAASESDLDIIDPMRSKNITSTTDYILSVLEQNFEFWKHVDMSYEINAVEQPFSYVLYQDDDVRIIMMGKIDLVLSDTRTNLFPMDHKSVDRDYGVKSFQNQFTNYSIATGSNIVLVNRIGLQSSLKPEEKFKRVPVSYDPLKQEQWRANTIKWAFRYLENTQDNDWPENRTGCDKWNRLCEYYDVCDSSGDEAKEYKLNAFFKKDKPWDVGKAMLSSTEQVALALREGHGEG
tara:strand:+ start:10112 stop:11032 length:921 start_codon:yes stop_codon:yes gene_type:complete